MTLSSGMSEEEQALFEELERRLHGPGNGLRDIYYVSADALLR